MTEEKLKKRGSKKSKRQVNIQEVQVLLKGVTEEKELSRQDMAEDRRMSTPGIKNKGKGRKIQVERIKQKRRNCRWSFYHLRKRKIRNRKITNSELF